MLTREEVVAALLKVHPILEKYFFSGSANRLMLVEADIICAT